MAMGSPTEQTRRRPLRPDPDRLLPPEPGLRRLSRDLYSSVAGQPIISPHGHVDVNMLVDNQPFADPSSLLISPDHYVTRLLHTNGENLADLGAGGRGMDPDRSRNAWRILCRHWQDLAATPVRYWLESQLADIFDVEEMPSEDSAERIYDHLADRLSRPKFLPRALFARFGIKTLVTTDDPTSDLLGHRRLAEDPTWPHRVIPGFRPDRFLEVARTGWPEAIRELAASADREVGDYDGYLQALRERRQWFIEHGATSTDHGHADAGTQDLGAAEASRIFALALRGAVTEAEATAFRRHMILQMAAMSAEDGLVMTIHPGVARDHHPTTHHDFGPDTGADIPVAVEFTRALQPLLARFGTAAGFHLVAFTVDETTWSRELAPLAGFYPALYIGVPWWFLDAPRAIRRFRDAVTETAGYTKTSGFVDDTRAFCSIPARHDMSRRVEAGILASQVGEGLIGAEEAAQLMTSLAGGQAERVFKLEPDR